MTGPPTPYDPGPVVRTADGVTIATYELGGDGPPLLLVHATGFHGLVWAPFAAHLAGRFRCVALDLRGHGRSGPDPTGTYDWDRFTLDIEAVLGGVDGLVGPGGQGPSAVGHSCGGAALLLTEVARPGALRALYCFEPVVMPPGRPGAELPNVLAIGARRRREVFASRQEALERFRGKPPVSTFDPAVAQAYVDHGVTDLPDGEVLLCCRAEDEARMYEAAGRHHAWDHLGEVAAPTTLACGGPDAHFDAAAIAAMAGRMPRARTEVWPALGHFGPLEQPAVVAAAVAAAFDG